MTKIISASALLIGLFSMHAQAHYYPESPSCRGPKKPLQFVTELDKKEFDDKVAEFRQCLEDFVSQQNKAIEKHQLSAEKASNAWKNYVEGELGQTLKSPETSEAAEQPDAAASSATPSPSN